MVPANLMTAQRIPAYETSSEIREYLSILRLRKWSILVLTCLVTGLFLAYSLRQTPVYQSGARVLVSSGLGTNLPNLETEQQVATSIDVAGIAAKRSGEPGDSPEVLLGGLSVEALTDASVLIFHYAHSSAEVAQLRTQLFADSYLEHRRQSALSAITSLTQPMQDEIASLERQIRELNDQIAAAATETERVALEANRATLTSRFALLEQQIRSLVAPDDLNVGQVLEPAGLPSAPITPNHVQNAIFGLLLGIVLGTGWAFLRERLDDRLRDRGDFQWHVRAPVLAVIMKVPSWRNRKQEMIVSIDEPRSVTAEAYRTLRTSILFVTSQSKGQVLMVTSPSDGEGKTATVANLGVTLAQSGRRVIVVALDLRRPRLHAFFDCASEPGATDVLARRIGVGAALRDPGIDNLRLLVSGAVPHNPVELLGSEAMGELLADLRSAADVILLDVPPVLGVADAITLAPFTDGVLFVADAQRATRSSVVHARAQLEQVDARIIGAVLNNFDPSKTGAGPYGRTYQGYYWHASDAEPESSESRSSA